MKSRLLGLYAASAKLLPRNNSPTKVVRYRNDFSFRMVKIESLKFATARCVPKFLQVAAKKTKLCFTIGLYFQVSHWPNGKLPRTILDPKSWGFEHWAETESSPVLISMLENKSSTRLSVEHWRESTGPYIRGDWIELSFDRQIANVTVQGPWMELSVSDDRFVCHLDVHTCRCLIHTESMGSLRVSEISNSKQENWYLLPLSLHFYELTDQSTTHWLVS